MSTSPTFLGVNAKRIQERYGLLSMKLACIYLVQPHPKLYGCRTTEDKTTTTARAPNFLVRDLLNAGYEPLVLHQVFIDDGSGISQMIQKEFLDVEPYAVCWFKKE